MVFECFEDGLVFFEDGLVCVHFICVFGYAVHPKCVIGSCHCRLFSEILVKASESNDIQFSADGNWFPIRPKEEEVKIEDDSLLVQTISGNYFRVVWE